MIYLDQNVIRKQIARVTDKPFDFWLVHCHNDYKNLDRFFGEVKLPAGAEVFTSELLYPGLRLGQELDVLLQFSDRKSEAWRQKFEKWWMRDPYAERLRGFAWQKTHCNPNFRLWLGAPFVDWRRKNRMFNAYLMIHDGKIKFVHHKKFLWPGEKHLWHVDRFQGKTPISVPDYNGIFENKAILTCYEADKFYNPKWRELPTQIPQVRQAKPDFVIIPAQWDIADATTLRKIALAISRGIREKIDHLSAVREQGVLTLVINDSSVYVCGPVDEKRTKARVYADLNQRGWLRITNDGITFGYF